MLHWILLLLSLWCHNTYANILYLDKNHITITPQFNGDYINLYGIQPETGFAIIVLKGEKETYYIQKKEKKMGVWVKGHKRKFTDVYRYYNIISEHTLDTLNISHLIRPFEIGIENINTYNTTVADTLEAFEYKNALFQNKVQNNLYTETYNANITTSEKFLYTKFHIPRNIPEGNYIITVYIINENEIKKIINLPLYISYSDFLKFITNAAQHQKLLYLFLSITSSIGIALFSYAILGKKYLWVFDQVKKLPNKTIKQNHTIETTPPIKRKRGRPKKDEQIAKPTL